MTELHRGRVSDRLLARVHAVPRSVHRAGRQSALCGVIPTDSGMQLCDGRWRWTDDEVDCKTCLMMMDRNSGDL